MDMITKHGLDMRRSLFAFAILFGVSTTATAAPTSAELGAETLANYLAWLNSTEPAQVLNDYDFGGKNFLGHLLRTGGNDFHNTNDFTSEEPFAIGLHVWSADNNLRQSGNIFLAGDNAVGLRVDGSNNHITISNSTTIISDGRGGKGLLISGGKNNRLNIRGTVTAADNAVEFNSADELGTDEAHVEAFNLSGTLRSDLNAIYIGDDTFVRTVNVNEGAKIFGRIISSSKYAMNLNFNASQNYDGDIFGKNIRLNVNSGTLKFSGWADVAGVDVAERAELLGGYFITKNFVNRGTIGADSPETNLIIDGNLVSSGLLKKISGGSQGFIIVHGNANVEGSTVTTDTLLPNETDTVLIADSITGNIINSAGNPVPISAMLNATGEVVGNTLTVTTYEANNLGKMSSQEAKTFDAMKNMFVTLEGDTQQNEMRGLYNLDTSAAKQTLTQISSNDAAQIMTVAQQSTAVDKMIAERITDVFAPNYVNVNVRPMNFSDDDTDDVTVGVKVSTHRENNFWLNFMKNWGSLRGGTDYHGSVIVGGYDRAIGDKWRAGIFATYGTIGYGAESSRASVYDTRLGLYAGYHNQSSDAYIYVNGGRLRNSLHRGLSSLGLTTNADYRSRIIEIGGEYKYDLQPKRTWHVSPFINFQASHLKQNSYSERGAGIYNQHVAGDSNTYFAAQIGLDLKRYCRMGTFGLRFGLKHGFTGADPDLQIRYEGDGTRSYRLRQKRDKTHFVFSVRGENEFADGWFVSGEAEFQLGEHDKDLAASVMLRRTW